MVGGMQILGMFGVQLSRLFSFSLWVLPMNLKAPTQNVKPAVWEWHLAINHFNAHNISSLNDFIRMVQRETEGTTPHTSFP